MSKAVVFGNLPSSNARNIMATATKGKLLVDKAREGVSGRGVAVGLASFEFVPRSFATSPYIY